MALAANLRTGGKAAAGQAGPRAKIHPQISVPCWPLVEQTCTGSWGWMCLNVRHGCACHICKCFTAQHLAEPLLPPQHLLPLIFTPPVLCLPLSILTVFSSGWSAVRSDGEEQCSLQSLGRCHRNLQQTKADVCICVGLEREAVVLQSCL